MPSRYSKTQAKRKAVLDVAAGATAPDDGHRVEHANILAKPTPPAEPKAEVLYRMVDLGHVPVLPELALLHESMMAAFPAYVDALWPASFLDPVRNGAEVDRRLLAVQASFTRKGASPVVLNSVYAEKARIIATGKILQQIRKARANLFGRVRHMSTRGDEVITDAEGRTAKRLLNFPAEWSTRLTARDLRAMRARFEGLEFDPALALLREVRDGTADVPALHAEALRAMIGQVQDKFGRPEWKPDGTVQVMLDYRAIERHDKAWPRLLTHVQVEVVDAALVEGTITDSRVRISDSIPHGERIVVPMTFRHAVLSRLVAPVADDVSVSCVAVEVGRHHAHAKAVLALAPREPVDLSKVRFVVGRDVGSRVTCAYSVVAIAEGALTQERLDLAARIIEIARGTRAVGNTPKVEGDVKAAKLMAREYLSTHVSGVEPVEQVMYPGLNYRDLIFERCGEVAVIQTRIAEIHKNVKRSKHRIARILGTDPADHVDLEKDHSHDELLDILVARLRRRLATIAALKAERTAIFASIDGLRRSWFGWVSNREQELLARYPGAVLVREDLDFVTRERKAPDYRGRLFNRLIDAQARGKYARCASDKLGWRSIREIVVPSFHTSVTDHRHGIVDGKQRVKDVFRAKADKARSHADEHASLTIALWLILGRKVEMPTSRAA